MINSKNANAFSRILFSVLRILNHILCLLLCASVSYFPVILFFHFIFNNGFYFYKKKYLIKTSRWQIYSDEMSCSVVIESLRASKPAAEGFDELGKVQYFWRARSNYCSKLHPIWKVSRYEKEQKATFMIKCRKLSVGFVSWNTRSDLLGIPTLILSNHRLI